MKKESAPLQTPKPYTRLSSDLAIVCFLEHIKDGNSSATNEYQLRTGHNYTFVIDHTYTPYNPNIHVKPTDLTLVYGAFNKQCLESFANKTTLEVDVSRPQKAKTINIYLNSIVAIIDESPIRSVVWRSSAISTDYMAGIIILSASNREGADRDHINPIRQITKEECEDLRTADLNFTECKVERKPKVKK